VARAETSSDFRQILEAAKTQGWRAAQTRKGHWKLYAPDNKTTVHTCGTPSDSRGIKNFVARLRQHGLVIPHRGTSR
jgi:hypothetical protein